MKTSLYQLTANWEHLLEMLYDSEIPEETVLDTLESIESEIEDKADNYAKIIREFEGNVNTLIDEIARLQDKRNHLEANINRLKSNLYNSMKATGKTKFKTDLFSFNIAKNGGKQSVIVTVDTANLPDDLVIVKEEPDKEAIRKLIEGGDTSYGYLAERGESLRIK